MFYFFALWDENIFVRDGCQSEIKSTYHGLLVCQVSHFYPVMNNAHIIWLLTAVL